MTPEETRGRIFKITAKHSSKSIRIRPSFGQFGQEPPGRIVLCQDKFSDKLEFHFLLFPMDDGTYIISSRKNGNVVDIFAVSNDDRIPSTIFPYHGKDNQRFTIEDTGDGFCFIRAKHSGKVLDVKGNNKDNLALIHQFHKKSGSDAANQLFKFEAVGTYQMPGSSAIEPLPIVPAANSFQDNLPEETVKVVRGETLLPYFVIDETLPKDKQVEQTPYYRLQKLQFWTKVFQTVFAGPAQTTKHTVMNGMSKTHSVEMKKTTKFSIEASGHAAFLEKLSGLKVTIARELSITETITTTTETSTTVEREVSYVGGQQLLYAEYVLSSQFSLQRASGIGVKEPWTASNSEEIRQVGFPVISLQKIRAKVRTK